MAETADNQTRSALKVNGQEVPLIDLEGVDLSFEGGTKKELSLFLENYFKQQLLTLRISNSDFTVSESDEEEKWDNAFSLKQQFEALRTNVSKHIILVANIYDKKKFPMPTNLPFYISRCVNLAFYTALHEVSQEVAES